LKKLIVIAGPTAVGKTAFSIQLALQLQTVILSADSRQFYREMNIGTAKPSEQELSMVPHYFINSKSIHHAYHVADFEKEAIQLLNNLFEKHDQVIMTGGSGLFIRAVCEGLDEFPDIPQEIVQNLQHRFETEGLLPLVEELQKADEIYSRTADLQNPRRVIRALSVYQASGLPFSSFLTRSHASRNFQPVYICLDLPREILYQRINQRVLQMMETGLLEEARALYPYRHLPALQTVGYTELFDFIEGKTDLEQAIGYIQQHSRNYAKRQVTWFKKYGGWKFIHPEADINDEFSMTNYDSDT
jgi:tRNA dimethylallyltransferase